MIYILMGKSATGKDNIYRELLADASMQLLPLVIYTTRPMRAGEENGREYYFTDEAHLNELRRAGRIIEERCYNTVFGPWYYFTADEGQIRPEGNAYLGIGTLESYVKVRDYFGAENVCPLYIEVDARKRLERSIRRESQQETPNYKEVCRRFVADEEDFSEEKIAAAGIMERFSNDGELEKCIAQVKDAVR